jgi:hypothetical protein
MLASGPLALPVTRPAEKRSSPVKLEFMSRPYAYCIYSSSSESDVPPSATEPVVKTAEPERVVVDENAAVSALAATGAIRPKAAGATNKREKNFKVSSHMKEDVSYITIFGKG